MAARCKAGDVPVVRLALKNQACARASMTQANTPEKIRLYVQEHYGCQPQEYAIAIATDSKLTPLAIIEISMGAMGQVMVDPKVLFSALLLTGATSFILFHNHPSGDPEPSAEDIALTKQINEGAKILGIRMVDHMVLGADEHLVSFYGRGILRY